MLKTFLQHIAVVLCKKRLQKTANIRKMRANKNGSKNESILLKAFLQQSCSMQKTAPKNS